MLDYLRFKYRRQIRRSKKQFKLLRSWAYNYYERHLWGKWRHLGIVRRFILVWGGISVVALIALANQIGSLTDYYLTKGQQAGGVYTEGVVGEIKTINPILPEGAASADATKLVFSGLTRLNDQRQIEPDLAQRWDISDDGKTYTFHLREGVKWHDGVPFTAQDVEFTLLAIQTPDTRSPLAASWQGVEVKAEGERTVIFKLPNAYSPFLHATTLGILPRHKLELVEPKSLRAHDFNQKPIGTGPFKVQTFKASNKEIDLVANTDFYRGKPLLEGFNLRWYTSYDAALEAYAKKQIQGIAQIPSAYVNQAKKLPGLKIRELTPSAQTNLFFKTTAEQLKDKKVRQALALAVNRQELVERVLKGRGVALRSPILPGQIGYSASRQQAHTDLARAKQLLDEAGWKLSGQFRAKDGQRLELRLVTREGGEYAQAAKLVQKQWEKVGVKTELKLAEISELQQSYIRPRNYDVLLFGINIGADPDPYPFWHSSQGKDPGLNLSQYSSKPADLALESGRIVKDNALRAAKYQSFLSTWIDDAPSVVLYGSYYLYGTNTDLLGVKADRLVSPSDRLYATENWSLLTKPVPKLKK